MKTRNEVTKEQYDEYSEKLVKICQLIEKNTIPNDFCNQDSLKRSIMDVLLEVTQD